jgi:hypothetical protein
MNKNGERITQCINLAGLASVGTGQLASSKLAGKGNNEG